jgi:hypothetical protein
MRWPFVSRTAYDLVLAILTAERTRTDALLEKYHAVVAPKPDPAPLAVPEFKGFPPVVASALARATVGVPKDVARAVYRRTQAMLDGGDEEPTAAAAVLRGERIGERDD